MRWGYPRQLLLVPGCIFLLYAAYSQAQWRGFGSSVDNRLNPDDLKALKRGCAKSARSTTARRGRIRGLEQYALGGERDDHRGQAAEPQWHGLSGPYFFHARTWPERGSGQRQGIHMVQNEGRLEDRRLDLTSDIGPT